MHRPGLSLVAHIEKVWKFKERSTTSNRSSMHVSPRLLIPQNTTSPRGNEGQLQPYPGGVSCFWQNMPRFTVPDCRVKNSKVSTVQQQVGLLMVLSFFNLSWCLNPWRVRHNINTKSSYKFKNVNDGQTAVRTHESRWCSNFETKNLTESHGQIIYHNRQQNEIAATLVTVVWRLHFIGWVYLDESNCSMKYSYIIHHWEQKETCQYHNWKSINY